MGSERGQQCWDVIFELLTSVGCSYLNVYTLCMWLFDRADLKKKDRMCAAMVRCVLPHPCPRTLCPRMNARGNLRVAIGDALKQTTWKEIGRFFFFDKGKENL